MCFQCPELLPEQVFPEEKVHNIDAGTVWIVPKCNCPQGTESITDWTPQSGGDKVPNKVPNPQEYQAGII